MTLDGAEQLARELNDRAEAGYVYEVAGAQASLLEEPGDVSPYYVRRRTRKADGS
jgi:hypothetical protein